MNQVPVSKVNPIHRMHKGTRKEVFYTRVMFLQAILYSA